MNSGHQINGPEPISPTRSIKPIVKNPEIPVVNSTESDKVEYK